LDNRSQLGFYSIYLEDILNLEIKFNQTLSELSDKIDFPSEKWIFNKDKRFIKNSISVTVLFPYWLIESLPIKKKVKEDLMLAGAFYSRYILTLDSTMDDTQKDPQQLPNRLILINILQIKAMELLRQLFPSDSPFWKYYDKYMLEYWKSVAWEKEHSSRIRRWCITDIERIGGKSAPFKVAGAAIAILANKEEEIAKLEKLIEYSQTAIQMIDDIDDWKDDLINNNYSYFLCETAYETKLIEDFNHESIIKSSPKFALTKTLNYAILYIKKTLNIMKNFTIDLKSLKEYLVLLMYNVENVKRLSIIFPKAILSYGTSRFMDLQEINKK